MTAPDQDGVVRVESGTPLVRMCGIGKAFGPVEVLKAVDLEVRAGEVLILAGENGAGKSTLMKILGGVYASYEGQVEMGGKLVRPRTPLEADALGIAVIHQELSLVPSMTVAENIFLGRPLTRWGWVAQGRQRAEASALMRRLGLAIDVVARVEDLPLGQQQLVEIAKALARRATVMVMDEPTSALNAPEVEVLFRLVRDLTARGCGVVYITHKMEEIGRIGDRVAVLRDGRLVGVAAAKELPAPRLIQWMVGRELGEQFPRHAPALGAPRLKVAGFSVWRPRHSRPAVADVSLEVRAGEVIGLAGLQGSGATDLLLGLFGVHGKRVRGEAWVDGRPLRIANPRIAIGQGMAMLTNDRKATGLVLSMSVAANTTLASLRSVTPYGWLDGAREASVARKHVDGFGIRAASLDQEVGMLSGGNQQKVALAKWMETGPRLLLLDEPTRGIDVGAKREIYRLMNEWTKQGLAILLITSELPELLAMSDRIAVLHRGRLTAVFPAAEATPERVMAAAMGETAEQTGRDA